MGVYGIYNRAIRQWTGRYFMSDSTNNYMKDIENRAGDWAEQNLDFEVKEHSDYQKAVYTTIGDHFDLLRAGYEAGATEERERGKRFAVWVIKNNLTFITDLSFITHDIYNSFLAEEKELTT